MKLSRFSFLQPISDGSAEGKVQPHYLAGLDGWRAIAILWVIVSHNQLYSWGKFNDLWIKNSGERGVQLFFALSGLLICNRLLLEEKRFGSISLRNFYMRRFFRIQPAALTYLVAVTLLMLSGVLPAAYTGVAGAAVMVRNLWPGDIRPGTWFAGHFWSLAVEEQFYLFFPAFLAFCRTSRIRWLMFVVVILETWRLNVLSQPFLQRVTAFPAWRTDLVISEILLSAVVALTLERKAISEWAKRYVHPWAALLYAIAVLALLKWHTTRLYHPFLISIYPALLVSTMLHRKSLATQFLEWSPIRWIGRLSFSLYLWQELFFVGGSAPVPGSFRSHIFCCWLLTFLCAGLSYYFVEKPLIHFGHKRLKRAL